VAALAARQLFEHQRHCDASADYGYVLQTGRIALAGPARELLHNPQVRDAYLGGEMGTNHSRTPSLT
jgi:ABC-type branched-subunit amino acid transport system ATPase component